LDEINAIVMFLTAYLPPASQYLGVLKKKGKCAATFIHKDCFCNLDHIK
jgi:hypothetical protein